MQVEFVRRVREWGKGEPVCRCRCLTERKIMSRVLFIRYKYGERRCFDRMRNKVRFFFLFFFFFKKRSHRLIFVKKFITVINNCSTRSEKRPSRERKKIHL